MAKNQLVGTLTLDDLIDRMKEVFPTKDDLKEALKKQTADLENTIGEATHEILYAVHDRFDDVEDRLDRIEDRLDRHLAV